ncbi:MAG TPA: L,D-transpeptidase family protein [Clostridia bacterium]|nr:L,D-transpeptidase family protein [Clostridia bacterium]
MTKLGYNPGPIDGIFGSKTETAVRTFQIAKGLVMDGIVGNNTWAAIDKGTMYKPPVPNDGVSNNELERLINSKNRASLTSYFIWIDLSHQRVNVFNGSNKKWNLVKSMVCSSGKASTPTIKGNFTVGSKGDYFIADSGARGKYYTQISGNYLFHSVLYDNKGNYVIDNTLGVPVSHGCVRLSLENAKYIYYNIPVGTAIWSN